MSVYILLPSEYLVGELIEKALSLLVDGEEVIEAIIYGDRGEMLCYPCTHVSPSYELVADLIMRLRGKDLIPPLYSYMILFLSNENVIFIPLNTRKVLALITSANVSPEVVAREMIAMIIKLLGAVKESKGDINGSSDGGGIEFSMEPDPFSEINEAYIYAAKCLVELNLLKKAMVLHRGGYYAYPTGLNIPFDLINQLYTFHVQNYPFNIKYRLIRISITKDCHLLVIPFDEETILIGEIDARKDALNILRLTKRLLHGGGLE